MPEGSCPHTIESFGTELHLPECVPAVQDLEVPVVQVLLVPALQVLVAQASLVA